MTTCPRQRQNAKKRSRVIYGFWHAEIGLDTKILAKAHKPGDGLENKFLSICLPSFGLGTTMPECSPATCKREPTAARAGTQPFLDKKDVM